MIKTYENLENQLINVIEIPRMSGDEKRIIKYIKDYCSDLDVNVIEEDDNLIIDKINQKNNDQFVIVQGHLDMVYVKEDSKNHDYNDGIKVLIADNFITADGTSLGADNGVGISYILNLISVTDEHLPNFRLILTSEEEVGLVGASKIEEKYLNSKYLINVDTETEGVAFIGCAGGARAKFFSAINREYIDLNYCNKIRIQLSTDKGGHSGINIKEIRGNGIKYFPQMLEAINEKVYISLITGSGKANAISKELVIEGFVNEKDIDFLYDSLKKLEDSINNEITPEDSVKIKIKKLEFKSSEVYTKKTLQKLSQVIELIPQGVYSMSPKINGLVQTSLNVGELSDEGDGFTVLCSIRSSVESQMNEMIKKLKLISKLNSSNVEVFNRYPAWEINNESNLVKIAEKVYQTQHGKKLTIEAIHAGLECGYFSSKNPELDIISIGPDIFNAHTTEEKCDLDSFYRTWDFLCGILYEINKEYMSNE